MTIPLYYIKSGNLSFGEKIIFEDIEFYLYPGDKISLVGKNGCGKSSLLKTIYGEYELDTGKIFKDPKVEVAYLYQDFSNIANIKVIDLVLQGINYEEYKSSADFILNNLKLSPDLEFSSLSGGQKKRAMLARTLTLDTEILLLDEPTNHLDIESIQWLEEYIKNSSKAVITISHDRAFLSEISNKIWWLDRGCLRLSNTGFKHFDQWQEDVIKEEENKLHNLNKKLAQEKIWLNQGVTGRRKRNQRRLTQLKKLRQEQREFQQHLATSKQKLSVSLEDEQKKSKFIIEANKISYSYSGKKIFNDFSIKVKKGEKIGVIGPNGSGKSTLVKLLAGLNEPETGSIKRGNTLEITYFDQHRTDLNPNDTLCSTLCPAGGDTVFLKNRSMHAAAYLKQFLFDPKMLYLKVANLSGGEKNRLLLAKLLINPGNFLILDEPTNDLDMDTVDLLLEILADYDGTLIVISHDRDFLDKLVTRTLILTSEGKVEDFIGGYEDYLHYYQNSNKEIKNTKSKKKQSLDKVDSSSLDQKTGKISYKYLYLQESLPGEISQLENEIKNIENKLSDPLLYSENYKEFKKLTENLKSKKIDLENKFSKWIEVEDYIKSN